MTDPILAMIRKPRNTALWLAAVIAIVLVSLSIHVVMLQVLMVPYPDAGGLGAWRMLYPLAQSLGLVWLAATTAPSLTRFHPLARPLLVALLFATMNGIGRNWLMEGVTTTDYVAPLGGLVRQALLDLVVAALAVAGASYIRGIAGRIVLAVAIAACWLFVLQAQIGALLAPLMRMVAGYARPEVYIAPYGANVLVPSYLSFAETVIACLVARLLVMFRWSTWDPAGTLRFVVLILLVRGMAAMIVWSPMIGVGPFDGMLSASQFVLQDIAMALLIQWAFVRFVQRA